MCVFLPFGQCSSGRVLSGRFDHNDGQKSVFSGCHLHCCEVFSSGFLSLVSSFLCNLVRKSLENLVKIQKILCGEILENSVTSLALHALVASILFSRLGVAVQNKNVGNCKCVGLDRDGLSGVMRTKRKFE